MQDEFKVNVLLVDDHPENLLVLEAILGGLGQTLVKAHSGEEALRCLLERDFAVILLDVQMPHIDGFETAMLIRQRERSRKTPIIFLTAFSTSDSLMFKGYSLGAVDYLHKPIDPTILTSKVSVFVDLFKKNAEIERQAQQLKAINRELRQSEERFRTLSACSPVGIFLIDTNGHCTYTNPQFQTICGLTLEESLGEGWITFLHPQYQEEAIAHWLHNIRHHQRFSAEYQLGARSDPGEPARWVHVRTAPMFTSTGDLIGHVGTLEDITERKQAEAIREQVVREQAARQQAEAANRMKDEFLAIVSHELRTPLNSILGWAHLLQHKEMDQATMARALETIERNARSQTRLIDDVLDISRIVQGKLRLSRIPVNLINVIQTTLLAMQPLADAKEIHLESRLDEAAQLAFGDPERLQQIMGNLLSNAIKFTPVGGTVQVHLHRLSRLEAPLPTPDIPFADDLCPPPDFAQIHITDTGIGIAADFLPHVFDRFRQADSSSTRSHGGLGLGLAIVHYLVELHGGTITASSPGIGQGATFTILLPLSVSDRPLATGEMDAPSLLPMPDTAYAPAAQAPGLQGIHILLMEDHSDTRDLLQTTLGQLGGEVTVVASTQAALESLAHHRPDILLTDLSMAGEEGYHLIRQIRELERSHPLVPPLPAIALTARTLVDDPRQVLGMGFQAYVAKPIELNHLLTTLVNLIQPAALRQV